MGYFDSNNAAEIAEDENSFFPVPNPKGTPERRLLLAVLERAILDYVGNSTREAEEAAAWLFSHEQVDSLPLAQAQPFSFAWVCQELDLDCARVTKIVRQMPKRGNHRIAPWYFDQEKTYLKMSAPANRAEISSP
jgi:hypothetical protein